MSESDENDPFEGLVTTSSLESQRESRSHESEFAHGGDEPGRDADRRPSRTDDVRER
ncbi:hypothetical protein [Blastococcus sp. TF02A-35]|uniref:hypothetical protein n=1 Tax=Blastococcus sp. TF02A-35 TaxID=2559612 RepID=UPI0014307764|nr:hypothetical protein [Blastococcus sp. TF02A_35]